jgi:hypothetical protein
VELDSSLLLGIISVDIFNFDDMRNELNDLYNFAETIIVNSLNHFPCEKLDEFRASLVFNLRVFSVYSIDLIAELSDKLMSFLILHRLLNYSVLSLYYVNNSIIYLYINILIVIN